MVRIYISSELPFIFSINLYFPMGTVWRGTEHTWKGSIEPEQYDTS